jgi:hypothetical protein
MPVFTRASTHGDVEDHHKGEVSPGKRRLDARL